MSSNGIFKACYMERVHDPEKLIELPAGWATKSLVAA